MSIYTKETDPKNIYFLNSNNIQTSLTAVDGTINPVPSFTAVSVAYAEFKEYAEAETTYSNEICARLTAYEERANGERQALSNWINGAVTLSVDALSVAVKDQQLSTSWLKAEVEDLHNYDSSLCATVKNAGYGLYNTLTASYDKDDHILTITIQDELGRQKDVPIDVDEFAANRLIHNIEVVKDDITGLDVIRLHYWDDAEHSKECHIDIPLSKLITPYHAGFGISLEKATIAEGTSRIVISATDELTKTTDFNDLSDDVRDLSIEVSALYDQNIKELKFIGEISVGNECEEQNRMLSAYMERFEIFGGEREINNGSFVHVYCVEGEEHKTADGFHLENGDKLIFHDHDGKRTLHFADFRQDDTVFVVRSVVTRRWTIDNFVWLSGENRPERDHAISGNNVFLDFNTIDDLSVTRNLSVGNDLSVYDRLDIAEENVYADKTGLYTSGTLSALSAIDVATSNIHGDETGLSVVNDIYAGQSLYVAEHNLCADKDGLSVRNHLSVGETAAIANDTISADANGLSVRNHLSVGISAEIANGTIFADKDGLSVVNNISAGQTIDIANKTIAGNENGLSIENNLSVGETVDIADGTVTATDAGLSVTNLVRIGEQLVVAENLSVDSRQLSVNNIVVSGDLSSATTFEVADNVYADKTILTAQNAYVSLDLSVGNDLSVADDISVGNDLVVTNDISAGHDLSVKNAASFSDGTVTVNDNIVTVADTLTADSNLSVVTATSVEITAALSIDNVLTAASDISTAEMTNVYVNNNLCVDFAKLTNNTSSLQEISIDLSTKIHDKIWIKNYASESLSAGEFSNLSVIKLSGDEYDSIMVDENLSDSIACESALYIIDRNYIEGYGQILSNIVMSDTEDILSVPDIATTRYYVDNQASALCIALTEYIDENDTRLSSGISSKVFLQHHLVGDLSDGMYDVDLSVIRLSADEYTKLILGEGSNYGVGPAGAMSAIPSVMYIVDDSCINAYGQEIKNVLSSTDVSSAVTYGYVNDQLTSITSEIANIKTILTGIYSQISGIDDDSSVTTMFTAIKSIKNGLSNFVE